MRVPEEVRQCVAFIGLPNSTGQVSFTGTAFFVAMPLSIKGRSICYLVTAKHVADKLENKISYLRINTKDGKSMPLQLDEVRWFSHPTDSSVDIAVLPYSPPLNVEYKFVPVDLFLSDDIIQKENIGVGDEVFITGLFAHVSGSQRNLPIVRMGNIAMMPDEIIPTDLGNIEAYLIEARSIGGLSGSPAFVRAISGRRYYFLGLMHGHWEIPPYMKNDLLMNEELFGKVNMGIAIVIPAKRILEVLNQPELIARRERAERNLEKTDKNTP